MLFGTKEKAKNSKLAICSQVALKDVLKFKHKHH